jgi:hypothetical protein
LQLVPYPVALCLVVPYLDSPSFSARARQHRGLAPRVRRYVPASVVPCIPLVRRLQGLVPSVWDRDCRLRARFAPVADRVRLRAVPASVTFLAA